MTIKQHGGIFGRNPSFNNVTVDGTLSGLSSLTLSGGNLVVSDGNGIDFSATSGTGTSELFSDYEEGAWTPTYFADGTDFTSVTYSSQTFGSYTKIGNVVYVTGRIKTSAVSGGSGSVKLSGLPYPLNKSYQSLFVGYHTGFAGDYPYSMWGSTGQTYMNLIYGTSFNLSATSSLQVADLTTASTGNDFMFSGFYTTDS